MRRFEMREGGSSKFWEASCTGSVLTVRFGKIGSDGQTQTKKLASPAAAQKELDKLVAEKMKKGYVELVSLREGDPEWPPKQGVLAEALALFESLIKKTAARSVRVGKVTFPAGGMKKWLGKPLKYREGTIADLFARAADRAGRGEHFLELKVSGEVLEIRGWDWLDDDALENDLSIALEQAASLQPKGSVKWFSRSKHGGTSWAIWKFVGKKLDVDEGNDFDFDKDARVQAALAEVAPQLQAWVRTHPDVPVRVERSGRWGHIDLAGDEVVPPTYGASYPFREGRAFVNVGLGGLRMLDENGTLLNGEWQYHGGDFSRGLAPVSVEEQYGYIDRDGVMKIRPQFTRAHPFDGPLAAVSPTRETQRWITIDGELVGDVFAHTHGFTEDRAWVWLPTTTGWGCVDEQARLVIPCSYYDCRPFSEGLAAVRASDSAKWAYVDARGESVIAAKFDEAHPFAEGRAIVKVGKQYRLIDRNGAFTSKPFDDILPTGVTPRGYSSAVREGVLGFMMARKLGYMNKDGKVIIEPQFVAGGELRDGLALVGVKKKVGVRYGHIDSTGAWVVPAIYEELLQFSQGRSMMKVGRRWGVIDTKGAVVVPPRYQQIQREFSEGRAWVQMP
jgi:predicted DNA-binding WGR domain protein